jgi:hypothetical protein
MITILFLLSLLAADAQQHDAHAPAAGKPATLMTGLGRLRHPIATRSAEAQRFFDQHDPVDGDLPDCSPAKARSPHRISSETAISDTAALLKAIAIIPS